jgi:hypothetical protein
MAAILIGNDPYVLVRDGLFVPSLYEFVDPHKQETRKEVRVGLWVRQVLIFLIITINLKYKTKLKTGVLPLSL